MARKKNPIAQALEEEDRVSLTPMIDIVFLLLAYFMVTTTVQKEEAQLGMQLPVETQNQSDERPLEAVISIKADGSILMNGNPVDHYNSREMPELTTQLERLKSNADSSDLQTVVTIHADGDSPHQRSIDAMNACAAADVEMVTFAN